MSYVPTDRHCFSCTLPRQARDDRYRNASSQTPKIPQRKASLRLGSGQASHPPMQVGEHRVTASSKGPTNSNMHRSWSSDDSTSSPGANSSFAFPRCMSGSCGTSLVRPRASSGDPAVDHVGRNVVQLNRQSDMFGWAPGPLYRRSKTLPISDASFCTGSTHGCCVKRANGTEEGKGDFPALG